MPPGITPRQRDVIRVPIPFAERDEEKSRPALVISSSTFNAQSSYVIVAAITSNLGFRAQGLLLTDTEFESGKLSTESKLIPSRVSFIDKGKIEYTYGRLRREAFDFAKEMLLEALRDV